MPGFKAQLARDIHDTFLNLDEFGEARRIEYAGLCLDIPLVFDTELQAQRSQPYRDHTETIYNEDVTVYCSLEKLGKMPKKGRQFTIDGDDYLIKSAKLDEKLITLVLEVRTE